MCSFLRRPSFYERKAPSFSFLRVAFTRPPNKHILSLFSDSVSIYSCSEARQEEPGFCFSVCLLDFLDFFFFFFLNCMDAHTFLSVTFPFSFLFGEINSFSTFWTRPTIVGGNRNIAMQHVELLKRS